MTLLVLLGMLAVFAALLYHGHGLAAWSVPLALGLLVWGLATGWTSVGWWICAVPSVALLAVFGVRPLRRMLVTGRVMKLLAPIFPRMSETERIALDAGTVWWDGELFGGNPSWKRLLEFRTTRLSPEERAFVEGPVEELCRAVDDWETHQQGDLSPEVWELLKKHKFMGMIIPKEHGGLGFSALAHSAVITKLSSHSVTAAVTAMVPNSLGPAELLLHYGTPEQREHYLPRLATGEEIPCFALTEPGAGSDAGSMRSHGVVCRDTWQGKETLGIRLNWDKRYITLSSAATLVGLAFKLRDPDHLLGETEELGITCALIPADTPGVELGERHDPMGIPFINGPTHGRDVFVPLDAIIGGPEMAGQGWRMLMECLSAGRSISLPALSCGAAQLATRVLGAYATVREQFGLPIGRFEGVQERLAEIGGTTYMLDAVRRLTASAVDSGQKPAVISAIVKAYSTEAMRRVVNAGMDVQGGAAIVRGPRNLLAHAYQAVPIGITVEGANILTRSMIIFGQGAIRCHPFAREEMEAASARDVRRFDRAFWGHVGLIGRNAARAFLLGLTGARLAKAPVDGPAAPWFRELTRLSAAYELCAETAMATLGGALKRKEALSGRLADGLAWLYLGSAVLKRFVDEHQTERDLPFARWACETAICEIRAALKGLLDNLPNRAAARAVRVLVFPLGARAQRPSDRVGGRVARALLDGGEARTHLTVGIHVPDDETTALGRLEHALRLAVAAAPARAKLKEAVKTKDLPRVPELELLGRAVEAGILTDAERRQIEEGAAAREDLIQVDAFDAQAKLAMCG